MCDNQSHILQYLFQFEAFAFMFQNVSWKWKSVFRNWKKCYWTVFVSMKNECTHSTCGMDSNLLYKFNSEESAYGYV